MKNLFTILILIFPTLLISQDYAMFETQYLRAKTGHQAQLGEEIREHNELFHNSGPYLNSVYYVNDGPNGGDFFMSMGPCTFSDLDNRPTGGDHLRDWQGVLAHCESVHTNEFWRLDADLSLGADATNETYPITRVTLMEVDDMGLFNKVWGQLNQVRLARGIAKPRVVYKNRNSGRNGRNVAIVYTYKNWAEMDEDNNYLPFGETATKVLGEEGYATWRKEMDEAIISSENEFHSYIPDLSGGGEN